MNLSTSSSSPFGMQMQNRTWEALENGYRSGFNGKERDDEVSGSGNQYDYGFRIYNPRLGRFLSVDPLTRSFPWLTPYQFAGNTPIEAIDLDGLEQFHTTGRILDRTKPHIKYEYRTLVADDGSKSYQRRIHRYNVVDNSPLTEDWEEISISQYNDGRKWMYINAGTPSDQELEVSASNKSSGTLVQQFQISNGSNSLNLDMTFKTYAIPDGLLIEVQGADGTWQTLRAIPPQATFFGGVNINAQIPLPAGSQAIRMTVTNNTTDDKTQWKLDGTITVSSGNQVTPRSSTWQDNWSNDFEFDKLSVTLKDGTCATGACNHQASAAPLQAALLSAQIAVGGIEVPKKQDCTICD